MSVNSYRSRDCVTLFKGDAIPVEIATSLAVSGWPGGQGVMWAEDPSGGFFVQRADGNYCGFLLNGSNESSDQHTSLAHVQQVYRIGTLCAGGWLIATTTYETYTWASRQVPPLVPLVYAENDRLRFSLRGYWTTEDEWTLSGDPRAPNDNVIGRVAQAPTVENNGYLTVMTII